MKVTPSEQKIILVVLVVAIAVILITIHLINKQVVTETLTLKRKQAPSVNALQLRTAQNAVVSTGVTTASIVPIVPPASNPILQNSTYFLNSGSQQGTQPGVSDFTTENEVNQALRLI